MITVGGGRRHEPTQPSNPRQLTIDQHVHSRACVERFTDAEGLVRVVRAGTTTSFRATPDNPVFCVKRVWDERVEHGLFQQVESAFQNALSAVLERGTVDDHDAITAYASIWQIRAQLGERPPEDVMLNGVPAERLTKEEEEIIEWKRGAFTRDGALQGRFAASIHATRSHDFNMVQLAAVRWGVLRTKDRPGFVCPGAPAGAPYIPVTPTLALVAGHRDREVDRVQIDHLNGSLLSRSSRLIFGHPTEVDALLARIVGAG
jgi:hypothetical protein